MKTLDFILLVRKMRDAQRVSARSHCSLDHRAARQLEEQVDKILKKINPKEDNNQITMF